MLTDLRQALRAREGINDMQLRLKSLNDVRKFTVTITLLAVVGDAVLQEFLLPEALLEPMRIPGAIISIMLAAPISYFVGLTLLDVYRLTVQLEHAADHDLLTGASTRTSFYKRIGDRLQPPFAVIVTDIDRFKGINDKFGHQSGDSALQHFANTLVRNCREDDLVARFGGEEFVILLQMAGEEEGTAAAKRLCQRVREKPLDLNGQTVHLTASFGVTQLDDISQIDEAIHRADIAVYRAKQSGRDQVCVYDPDIDSQPAVQTAAE